LIRAPYHVPVSLFLLVSVLGLAAILGLNNGRLIYTLDDPYIHLALAENIARGHYGINLQDYSAPASSILWPFLLAPFARSRLADWVPLILNFAFALATVVVVASTVKEHLSRDPLCPATFLTSALTSAFIFGTNLVGLAFNGMEHSLQVFLAVLIPVGIAREQESGKPPWWLLLALALGPMVRYELLALDLPAMMYLVLRGHGRATFLAAVAITVVLGGFSYFLQCKGLALLPSSVLVKSTTLSSNDHLKGLYFALQGNLLLREGALLGVVCAILIVVMLNRAEPLQHRQLAAWATSAGILHLVFGSFGWFSRYEIYIWSASLVALFLVFHGRIARFFTGRSPVWSTAVLAILTCALSLRYVLTTLTTPLASNNIYLQQYQMHRFVTEFYRQPVAVNDLGWVSYRNDLYVVDLEGLASDWARVQRQQAQGTEWMDALMKKHGARLVMIYDEVLPTHPTTWRRLGELDLLRPRFSPAGIRVAFYATDDSTSSIATKILRRFRTTLPAGAAFTFDSTGRSVSTQVLIP
jgi:hypothetical protein